MAAVEAQFSGQLLIAGGDGTPFARGDGFDRVEAEYCHVAIGTVAYGRLVITGTQRMAGIFDKMYAIVTA